MSIFSTASSNPSYASSTFCRLIPLFFGLFYNSKPKAPFFGLDFFQVLGLSQPSGISFKCFISGDLQYKSPSPFFNGEPNPSNASSSP